MFDLFAGSFLKEGMSKMLKKVSKKYQETALIKLIAMGLVVGILLALFVPAAIPVVSVFGDLFVKALKGVAPILVFVLVMNAISASKRHTKESTRLDISVDRANAISRSLSYVSPRKCRCRL
jgi:Na+/serine symporter